MVWIKVTSLKLTFVIMATIVVMDFRKTAPTHSWRQEANSSPLDVIGTAPLHNYYGCYIESAVCRRLRPELYLLLMMCVHASDGCLANPASVWSVGAQKFMLCIHKMQYAHEQ